MNICIGEELFGTGNRKKATQKLCIESVIVGFVFKGDRNLHIFR